MNEVPYLVVKDQRRILTVKMECLQNKIFIDTDTLTCTDAVAETITASPPTGHDDISKKV